MKRLTLEYLAITEFYGNRKAKRSKVPLINHINEGIDMLRAMGASEEAIDAFCLHPIIQDDAAYAGGLIWLKKNFGITGGDALTLAKAYRVAANSYLCRPETDHYTVESLRAHVGYLNQDLVHMLFADKIQNEKDFELYHKGTHHRSAQLTRYFEIWLDYLEEMEAELKRVKQ